MFSKPVHAYGDPGSRMSVDVVAVRIIRKYNK